MVEEIINLGIDFESKAISKSEGVLTCHKCSKPLTNTESIFESGWAYCNKCFVYDPESETEVVEKDSLSKEYTKADVNISQTHTFIKPTEALQVKDIKQSIHTAPKVHQRLEQIGTQNALFGDNIALTQFKNLQQKQETKAKVLSKFKGEIFRSIIKAKEIDGNRRLDKLERRDEKDASSNLSTIDRADAYGRKDIKTLSTFPSALTMAYTNLLSKEGDLVVDFFCGHNSRATDVLAMGRKYVGFDIHTFPVDMTIQCCKNLNYAEENYKIHQQSSEKIYYPDNHFDFALTCPPYGKIEKYSEIYNEYKSEDLSNKDYSDFLQVYGRCIKEMYRVLKPGAFSVIVVGDTFVNQELQSLMLDTIRLAKESGFKIHDINIYDRGSNIGMDLNPVLFLTKLKRFGCVHEYIIILQKP